MNAEPDGFDVDVDRLSGQAGQFDGLVTRLGAIHRQLNDALAATGRCWGGDAVGQSFSAVHATPADTTFAQLTSLPDQVSSVGTRFSDTATSYASTDAAGVEHLNAADPTADA